MAADHSSPEVVIPPESRADSRADSRSGSLYVEGFPDFSVERERHGPLLGCEELLATVDEWQASAGGRGWLLVTGSPGAGKSALLAHLVERFGRPGRGDRVPPHHFLRRGHADWDQPYAVQASLVAQIEAQYPSAGNPDARPDRRLLELLLRLSNRHLIPESRQLVLVIDGLDEVATDGADNPLSRFLPLALPPGVFVIASIRSGHPYQAFFAERKPVRTIDLDRALGSRGIRAFWAHHGPRLGLPVDYQQMAARAAEGNMLHATLLRRALDELPFAEREGRLGEPVPFGLWGMLEYLCLPLWEGSSDEGPTDPRPICRAALGLLCAARDALTLPQLAELCEASQLPPLFGRVAAPFLSTDGVAPGGLPRYRIGHDAFRELLLARVGAHEMRRLHRRLVQTFAAWPPLPGESAAGESARRPSPSGASAFSDDIFRRSYALRYGVQHRADAGDWPGVELLTADVSFLVNKVREAGTRAVENDFIQAAARCPDPVRRKEWRDMQRAVREEAHWLRRDPDSLPSLLYNRLRCMGWPGARIGRALSMPQGVPDYRLQRGLGGHERTLEGHASSVYGCASTSDGKLLISASWDRTLKVWDLASGHQLLTLNGHTAEVTACVVLPDDRRVLSSSADNTLKVWELQSGLVEKTLLGHTGEVTACAAFPDGERVISGARDKTLRIWDLKSGQTLMTLKGHLSWVTACAVLDGGERVLSGSWDRTLKLWDVASGRELATLTGHSAGVRAIAVLAGGLRAVSGSEDHSLRLWDLSAGRQLMAFHGHTAGITACAILPDGLRMVSTAKDKTLRVWDLQSGEALATLQGHSAWVTACAVLPDGRSVVSGSDDYTLKIWDLAASHDLQALQGHAAAVSACVLFPDQQRLLTGAADRTLKLWDLNTGAALLTLKGHTDLITSCALLPDGRRAISGSWDRTLDVWDLETGERLHSLSGHDWFVTSCAVLPDGRRAISGSWDRTLRVWDLQTGTELQVLTGHTGQITCVAPLPDGHHVVSGARDNTLRVWDLRSGHEVQVLRGHMDFVTACVALPDGQRILSGSEDHTLKLWDLTTGEERLTLQGHAAAVSACALTHDARWAVSASSDHTIRVWDLTTGRCLDTVYGTAPFESVAALGERICAGDRVGHVWMLVSVSGEAPSKVGS